MKLEFRPIELDVASGDHSGMLVLRDGALLAVVARLGQLHDELAGSWFIETIFREAIEMPRDPFPDLAALDCWLEERIA